MDEKNMYTQMPPLPNMSDPPTDRFTYTQTNATAPPPPADMTPMMLSSDAGSIPIQPQQQQQQQQTFVQTQPVELQNLAPLPPLPPLGLRPCLVTCPMCHKEYKSTIRMEKTKRTHLIAALLCLLGGICFVWVPYYIDTFKDAVHYCSRCNSYLGTYKN